MPSTITTREGMLVQQRGENNPSGLRAGSLAHAAHTLSSVTRTVFFAWALQGHGAVTCGSVTDSRVQTPLLLVVRAWD